MSDKKNEQDYRSSLNLPKTDFAMKANLSQREPETLRYWQDIDLYETLRKQRKGKPKWILHDGPPYANGRLHLGHAVNKILKDVVVKSRSLSGFDAPYVPGWDCHGLPIEVNVEKKLGRPKTAEDKAAFRKACREYAQHWIEIQRDEFHRMGVLGDWANPYITMDWAVEANIIRALAKIYANGHIQPGYKPVQWCLNCTSALAEAEVEYTSKISLAIDVGFRLQEQELPKLNTLFNSDIPKDTQVLFVIWTTTPWTLVANRAVTGHPKVDYVLLRAKLRGKDTALVVAHSCADNLIAKYELTDVARIAHLPGAKLEGLLLWHPFYNRESPFTLGEYVTTDTGTGLTHSAPAYGLDDFHMGKRYNLALDNPVNDAGYYDQECETVGGWHIFKDEEKIVDLLEQSGYLLHKEKYTHQYPHCWRHKKPTIYRATNQWFISMTKARLIDEVLKETPKVQWVPEWGKERIENMMSSRPDWCISRQRHWGVPIPFFVHHKTGEPHPDTQLHLNTLAERIEKDGLEVWYALDPSEFLNDDSGNYIKSHHILDVWFDSGTTHFSILRQFPRLQYPADLYLEGSDQHRGFFQSSLLAGVAMDGQSPYKAVLTHGFTVDSEGRKMSKSIGNIIEPQKIIQKLGADVLRLWVANADYTNEMTISQDVLSTTGDMYRRIRNTARFLLANLHDFDPDRHILPTNRLLSLDAWIIDRALNLQEKLQEDYTSYRYPSSCRRIHNFCVNELGGFYLDIIKDRQYTAATDSSIRRSAQTAIFHILQAQVRWLAPILSFTAEEIWKHIPGKKEESVLLTQWYEALSVMPKDADISASQWEIILKVKQCVNRLLEEKRNAKVLGSPLEAQIVLFCEGKTYEALKLLQDELRFILITSSATLEPLANAQDAMDTEMESLKLQVTLSPHEKCARCWHRVETGQNSEHPNLCLRCVGNISGKPEERLHG